MQIKYVNCEYCGASIEGKAVKCPQCGAENKFSAMFIAEEEDEKNTPAFSEEEIKRDRLSRERKPREIKHDSKKGIRILVIAGVVVLLIAILELILL